MRYARAKTKRDAVVTALADYNRRQRMAEPVGYSGTSDTLLGNAAIEGLDEPCRNNVRTAPRRRGRRP